MDEYLWPARNVAEYAYCPRLFYLMEVEGLHLPNVDTESGHAVHRRVDQPSAEPEPDRPQAVRSLTLASQNLGLTATLDLAEIEGTCAVPVEYRRGRARRKDVAGPMGETEPPILPAAEPWPTDRIQLAFQAMLLEEAGYTVPAGVLYYAAEKRRLRIAIDEPLRREALDTLAAAHAAAGGGRPLPLLNDSRCLRCSLQPLCLPDEVNQQQGLDLSPRTIWPPRDDALHLVAQQEGVKLGISGLSMRLTDREGQVVREIPIASLESLAILGSVQISTQALCALADRGIPLAFCSGAGRCVALVDPLDSSSALIRRSQVRVLDQEARALELSRALVAAKIDNQRTLLMRNAENLSDYVAEEMADQSERAARAESLESLRGHEGQAAALYFQHFAKMLREPFASAFDAQGRQRRPPPDPVNAILSFGYTMLTHEVVAALRLARLEPSIGAYHVSRPGRPALALDLMEPFRPLIADSVAVSAFNRNELAEGHFQRTSAGCILSESGRRAFFSAWGRRMDTEVTHQVFGYRLSYRRMLMLHARLIAAWMLGEAPTLEFLRTR